MEFDMSIVKKVADTLVRAGSTFDEGRKGAYKRAIEKETNENAKWALETILENAEIAERNLSPLCDDTGIPHLLLEIGEGHSVSGEMMDSIYEGVRQGLRQLPGRPMKVLGDGKDRLAQSLGMDEDPGALDAAPILIRRTTEDVLRLHVLMFGGGPALRGKTLRIFHKHNAQNVIDELVDWAVDATNLLGCTPCVLAIGIGRSQFEATSMMLQAMVDGSFDNKTDIEEEITRRVNEAGVGASSFGGNTTVLSTFVKIGPQRASGYRVVCMRPCCCFEPRLASIDFD